VKRRQRIHDLLTGNGRLAVEALAGRLGVTPMTVRRDLPAMEQGGLLIRVHGGCVLPGASFAREASFSRKAAQHVAAKLAIARQVVRLLRPGQSVYMDTGTTCAQVARLLPAGLRLRVLTNNLRVAMDLFGRPDVEVHVFGGQLAPASPDLVGASAAARAMEFRVDVAVVGADAVDSATGEFGSADLATAALSRAAQRQAGRTIVAADASKVGLACRAITGRLAAGVTLVTDAGVPTAQRRALARTGARFVYAGIGATKREEA
jgi:DeoR family transcriptional regulator, fructose operon transcriptional repressor